MKNLVIVESPAKAKTIEKYLGKDYQVMATVGHIIDLPKSKLGVDIENNYQPEFVTIKGKGSVISKLKKAVPKNGEVYLAMDPDREGEAIAQHTCDALKIKNPRRVIFHEITKDAVSKAVKNSTNIDGNLVQAQIARRVLDRLVGYQVSGLIWKKIWYGLSAGRVQSVALRLIVEREEEREAFEPKEYWEVFANLLDKDTKKVQVRAQLKSKNEKKFIPKNEKEVSEVVDKVEGEDFLVSDVQKKEVKNYPSPPFTTSTLQQSANNALGLSSKRTMALAQALYQEGYITYMRTDSVNLSKESLNSMRSVISTKYGKDYLPEKPNFYKSKAKLAQEAHEAIRPTDFSITSDFIKEKVGASEARLYNLIYNRALASQMSPMVSEKCDVLFTVDVGDKYGFNVKAEKVLFDGFTKVIPRANYGEDLQQIVGINKGDIFVDQGIEKEQKFTKPRARYTEASLVKTLEKYGIGRPSTYSTIISTVQDRGYVSKEGKYLVPKDVGRVVNGLMKNSFERLVNYEYTANVEDELDNIATGELKYEPFIEKEYKKLQKEIEVADKEVKKEDIVVLDKSEESCPDCNGDMVVKLGRYGKFLSCSKFPKCKGMKGLDVESLDSDKYATPKSCPECDGPLSIKIGKFGKFWACQSYPDCKGTVPLLLNEECPECKKNLVERQGKWGKSFIGCSGYPNCKYIKKNNS